MTTRDVFSLTPEQRKQRDNLLALGKREVPRFIEDGVCEREYIPVRDGELLVYHHKPEKVTTKRPILFMPGYIAAAPTWTDFHRVHHGFCEYFYLESREKKSSRMKRSRKIKMTIKESANDLSLVLDALGLSKCDFVLCGSSYGGAIVLQALLDKKLQMHPTIILHDPIVKWAYTNAFTSFVNFIMPPFLMGALRKVIAKIYLAGMKNQAQKERFMNFVEENCPWKFRKSSHQNRKYDITDALATIDKEVFILHGPRDKYHPREAYLEYARKMPKGRFLFIDTPNEHREVMAGVVATEFAKVTKHDGLPKSLELFEIPIER